jgi:uncharacterized membrane protein required for colicin V production
MRDKAPTLLESVWFIAATLALTTCGAAAMKYLFTPPVAPLYQVHVEYDQTTTNENRCWFLCRQ